MKKLTAILFLLSSGLLSCNHAPKQKAETKASKSNDKFYEVEHSTGYEGGHIDSLETLENGLNFLVIGDWGRCGEYYQKEVAEQLSNASVSGDASFIISTGDNFYPRGVISASDPQFADSFENVYHQFSLQKDWYVVLGNHDYKTNPDAEVDYSKVSRRWHMPARYYAVKMPIGGDKNSDAKALFVYLDTSPLVDEYYSDPEYATEVRTADTAAQVKWLKATLADKDTTIKWKFVMGHHPLYTSGKRIKSKETKEINKLLKGIFEKYKVDAYICGHEHDLEYLKPEGNTHYFISGTGSEARPVPGKLPESLFRATDHGFMAFSVDENQILMHVIDWKGKILYSTSIKK